MFMATKKYFSKKVRRLLKSFHQPKDIKFRKGALASYTRAHGEHWVKSL